MFDDGTMVGVENARRMISKNIDIVVTSVLQTTAGKMIFGRYIEGRRRYSPAVARQPRGPPASTSVRRMPCSFHLWRTVFYLIPAVSIYTDRARHDLPVLDAVRPYGQLRAPVRANLGQADPEDDRRAGDGERLEHLEPGRSYVFAANHQSIYDIPIVFSSVPLQLRIVAKESLGRIPFMGWHLHRAGHLLVDRRNPGADIVQKMRGWWASRAR